MHMCVYMRTYIYMYKPPMCMRMEKGNRKVYRLHGLSYKYTFLLHQKKQFLLVCADSGDTNCQTLVCNSPLFSAAALTGLDPCRSVSSVGFGLFFLHLL